MKVQGFSGLLLFSGYKMATLKCFFVANCRCHVVAAVRALAHPVGWLLQFACWDTDGCRFSLWSDPFRDQGVPQSAAERTPFPPADWRVNRAKRESRILRDG